MHARQKMPQKNHAEKSVLIWRRYWQHISPIIGLTEATVNILREQQLETKIIDHDAE